MSGWIKLHRGLTEWEWYTEPNAMRVFIHCILKANHTGKKWRGIAIKRGEFIGSYDSISSELKLTVSRVRTAIKKLVLTNEITIKSSTQHTVFIVNNYDSYQSDASEVTNESQTDSKRIASESQTDDKQIFSTKNVKNVKNDNNVKNEENGKNKAAQAINFDSWSSNPGDEVLKEWLSHRKKRKLSISQLVINKMAGEINNAIKLGYSVDDCLSEVVERGWQGFKSEWIENSKVKKTALHDVSNKNYYEGEL